MEKECEDIAMALEERLEIHDNSRRAVQDRLHEFCEGLRRQINEMEENVNRKLEGMFTDEDDRLQETLADIRRASSSSFSKEGEEDENEGGNGNNSLIKIIERAKAELLVTQSYNFVEHNILGDKSPIDLTGLCDVKVEKHVDHDEIAVNKPINVRVVISKGTVFVGFRCPIIDEMSVLPDNNSNFPIEYRCLLNKKGGGVGSEEYPLKKGVDMFSFVPKQLDLGATYIVNVKMILGGRESEWSDGAEFTTPKFEECHAYSWKECPGNADKYMKYSVDKRNPRIATKGYEHSFATLISNSTIPTDTVTSWSIKLLESIGNNWIGIIIGVAPSDIDQNEEDIYLKCGWYLACYTSELYSGLPHKYRKKEYGPRKEKGQYVHNEEKVGVVMDTTKGELSFAVNGVNFGIAYEGIPLDKPLVSCVLFYNEGDSVELCEYELNERVDRSIPVPSNITAKSTTLDSIALTWDAIKGALLYQIEVDGSKFWSSSTNAFIKKGLLPDTEHTFRVRAVIGNKVSEWSHVVKCRTQEESFKTSGWKECPDNVDGDLKYSVDENNPRIATKISGFGYGYCTVIGNTPLPPNAVSSWGIKILKSRNNGGNRILIGVAPSDINQNEENNSKKCGWYLDCYDSTLYSGPPHNYWKEYGPRKRNGKYVRKGDIVGIMMDTTKGELSFALKGANLGVAYKEIPLDKPLVPCVLLEKYGDFVELITSGETTTEDDSCVIS